MGQRLPDRPVRRKAFLRALTAGLPVGKAAQEARIAWSTLYAWRRDEPKFRAAWDRAAGFGQDARSERFQSALYDRAVEGVDDPVYHAGEVVGQRKRYSDRLLLHALTELARLKAEANRPAPPPPPAAPPPVIRPGDHVTRVNGITVIVRRFGRPAADLAADASPAEPEPDGERCATIPE